MSVRTAVLLFTRAAHEEADHRPYHEAVAFRLVNRFISRAKSEIEQSGLDSFVLESTHQKGASFGEKLSNAFQDIFDQGYDNLIAIGNDVPTLTSGDIAHAESILSDNRMVFGPTSKGGVYLLGINRKAFDKKLFNELPWQTEELSKAIQNIYAGRLHLDSVSLETKDEVEDNYSLELYARKYADTDSLARWVESLLASLESTVEETYINYTPDLIGSCRSLRAPPVLL